MKFFAPILLSVADATISMNLDKLTNFDASLTASFDNLPFGPTERMTASGSGKAILNLFEGQMSIADQGKSHTTVDCETNPYARYQPECSNPIIKGLIETDKVGAGGLFVDVTTGKFGLRGHETGTNIHMADAKYAVSFCAVLDIPPRAHVLPPPAILKQRLNERSLKMVEQRLNSMPHSESNGIATFHSPPDYGETHGYEYTKGEFSVHTDGGDPVHMRIRKFDPDHRPYSEGWKGASEPHHLDGEASVNFNEWNSPATGFSTFTCPQGASTDLHAHPEAKRTLALMNTLTSHLRQHPELSFLHEDPAALFMAELDRHNQQITPQTESQNFMGSMVVPLLAGVSGGLVVLAFFQMTRKNRKQEVLLTEA